MQEGQSKSWREVLEKHHATLLDELSGCFDAAIRDAALEAAQQVREEARRMLTEQSESAEQRFQTALTEAQRTAEVEIAAAQAKLEARHVDEFDQVREKTRKMAGQLLGDQWNQFLRRTRRADSPAAVFQLLDEIVPRYAESSLVLLLEGGNAKAVSSQVSLPPIAVSASPAMLSVIETRDPVVAAATESELSGELLKVLKAESGAKAYLFPVNGRHKVVGVVAACGSPEPVALELVCEAAGLRLELFESESRQAQQTAARPAADFVQIGQAAAIEPQPVNEAGNDKARSDKARNDKAWNDLDPDEQKIHLQAQRFARVQVAEMRLYKPDAVRNGAASGTLYTALRPEIDRARSEFLNRFLSQSSTMVDYLHLELLRSLAHDNDRLFGGEYPGPMV